VGKETDVNLHEREASVAERETSINYDAFQLKERTTAHDYRASFYAAFSGVTTEVKKKS
jgi:hypothetical protein